MDRGDDAVDQVKPVVIDLEKVYNLVSSLDTKVDTYIGMQEPRLVLIDHRLSQVEMKQKESDARCELNKKEASDKRWQVTMAFIAAILAFLGTAALAVLQAIGK
jgi:hypothetical protein